VIRRLLLPVLACALLQAGTAVVGDAWAGDPPGVASCSGCHAISKTVETAVPRIIGRKADELTTAMLEFKAGKRPNTVMGRLAKGFTDEEIGAISAWFAAQKD
jgi:sulfide dehydrogenase cytochrome subunit